jgi:hypothetical protein
MHAGLGRKTLDETLDATVSNVLSMFSAEAAARAKLPVAGDGMRWSGPHVQTGKCQVREPDLPAKTREKLALDQHRLLDAGCCRPLILGRDAHGRSTGRKRAHRPWPMGSKVAD